MVNAYVPDILDRTHEILSPGRHRWTQDTDARDIAGNRVNYGSPTATCWCLAGAIKRAAGELYPNDNNFGRVYNTAASFAKFIGRDVTGFNDTSSYELVMDYLDRGRRAIREEQRSAIKPG